MSVTPHPMPPYNREKGTQTARDGNTLHPSHTYESLSAVINRYEHGVMVCGQLRWEKYGANI